MDRIGRYEIICELGRGAMGIVYKARDTKIGRDVAIKTIRLIDQAAPSDTQNLKERLFREAQSAGRLSHPGIVTIYDVAEEAGLAYITMEFVEGRTLENMMVAGEAGDPSFIVTFVKQMGAALDYAHAKGIVHRDIKPANMIITSEGRVKITDFGIARITSSQLTQTGTVLGTPSYMSPEQVRGESIDGRSDQFSLGVITYELITAQKPFVADSLTATIYKIVSSEPLSPRKVRPDVTPELEQAILKALAKHPGNRYATCRELADAIAEPCRTLTKAAPAPPPQPARKDAEEPTAEIETTHSERPSEIQPEAEQSTEETISAAAQQKLPPLASGLPSRRVRPGESTAFGRRKRWPLWVGMAALVLLTATGALALFVPSAFEDTLGLASLALEGLFGSEAAAEAEIKESTRAAVDRMQKQAAPPPSLPPAPESSAPDQPSGSAASTQTPRPEKEPAAQETASKPKPPQPKPPAPKPQPPPAPAKVPVRFVSDEPGVNVVVDGNPAWSCKTPCSLDIPSGRHEYDASKSGFRRLRRGFNAAGDSVEVKFELEPITGTVLISSSPPGADIFVDGKRTGQKTNSGVHLPPGRHVIKIEHGEATAEKVVVVEKDSIQTLRFLLQSSNP